MKKHTLKRRSAFTMIEIMMALVVVSIMLAVMAPVLITAKPSEAANIQVNNIDNTPVGVIVAWFGTNYPKGWLPVSGQFIDPAQYPELRNALGKDTLPDLNAGVDPENAAVWIIKAEK